MKKEKKSISVILSIALALFIFLFSFSISNNLFIAFTPNDLPTFKENIKVTFEKKDINLLKRLYQEKKTEYLFCLIGEKKGNDYIINSLEEPPTKKKTFNEILTEEDIACQGDRTIGTLHKHPRLTFYQRFIYGKRASEPSTQDYYSFGNVRLPLHIIQFDKDKFYASEYLPDKLIDFKSISIEVI